MLIEDSVACSVDLHGAQVFGYCGCVYTFYILFGVCKCDVFVGFDIFDVFVVSNVLFVVL